jgi:hypothetical protein
VEKYRVKVPTWLKDWLGIGRPRVSLLFIDDSFCEKTRISAMVGLLVPLSDYVQLRAGFYGVVGPFIRPEPGHIARPPEIHGFNLPGDTDEEKLRVVTGIVDLVVNSRMKVFRVGYYVTDVLQERFSTDGRLKQNCVASLRFMIKAELKKQLVIPVMDGIDIDIAKKFSSDAQMADIMRAAAGEKIMSISHSEHLIGEMLYADSEFAVFMQMVDIVAYLRKITDLRDDGYVLPVFKQKLLPLAQRLAPRIAGEHIIAMSFNGVVQGPAYRARRYDGKVDSPLTAAYSLDWAKAHGLHPIDDRDD